MEKHNRLIALDTSCLENDDLFDHYYDQMPQDRKKKIDALKIAGAKRLCLGAGILLNKALAEAGIIETHDGTDNRQSTQQYKIETGPQGKPYLAGRDDLFFNLSHSGTMAVIAVSGREVGVDIQNLKHFDDHLIDYVFNPGDRKLAKEFSVPIDRIYTRLWAMKESVMKYNGKGIGLEPKKISFRLEDGLIRPEHPSVDLHGTYIFEQEIEPEVSCPGPEQAPTFYGLAVCSRDKAFTTEIEYMNL
jgi:4'-phosphopantetheinyl transferase